MKTSESIVEISKALVKAQAKMGSAFKGAKNPFYKSKYSDLNSVIEACKEDLNSEGISVLQPISSDEHGDYVETFLVHTSGEFLASKMKLILAKQDMQAYGSAVSYARRYGLQAMVFIPSSEDDDGEKSMARETPAPTEAPKESKPVSSFRRTEAKSVTKTDTAKPAGIVTTPTATNKVEHGTSSVEGWE